MDADIVVAGIATLVAGNVISMVVQPQFGVLFGIVVQFAAGGIAVGLVRRGLR